MTCHVPDCDQLTADAYVCTTCAHRLRTALADVPDLDAELVVTLTRQDRPATTSRGPRHVDPPLPYRISTSIIRDALAHTLRTWALTINGDLLGHPPATTSSGLATWLRDRVEDIRQHPAGGAAVDELCAAVDAARDEVHGPARTPRMLAGHCPDCGTPVYAPQGATSARCHAPDCTGTVDVAEWRRRALHALDEMALSAALAARTLPTLGVHVTAAQIRQWAHRGRLTAVPQPDGRPRYLVRDIRALATGATTTATPELRAA